LNVERWTLDVERCIISFFSIVLFLFSWTATAATGPTKPPILAQVGIDQRIGAILPGDIRLTDETGKQVLLGEYLNHRPLILLMVSYKCPRLCPMVMSHMTQGLNGTTMRAGQDFDVVAVSFDPRETPAEAAKAKRGCVVDYLRGSGGVGWHFLVGDKDSLDKLERAVGFHCTWDPQTQSYAHAGGAIIISPRGVITCCFFGADFVPAQLRSAVEDAAAERVSPRTQAGQVYCFDYSPKSTRVGRLVTGLIQGAGAVTVLALGGYIGLMLRRDLRRGKNERFE
jgi:protein SCO1/2